MSRIVTLMSIAPFVIAYGAEDGLAALRFFAGPSGERAVRKAATEIAWNHFRHKYRRRIKTKSEITPAMRRQVNTRVEWLVELARRESHWRPVSQVETIKGVRQEIHGWYQFRADTYAYFIKYFKNWARQEDAWIPDAKRNPWWRKCGNEKGYQILECQVWILNLVKEEEQNPGLASQRKRGRRIRPKSKAWGPLNLDGDGIYKLAVKEGGASTRSGISAGKEMRRRSSAPAPGRRQAARVGSRFVGPPRPRPPVASSRPTRSYSASYPSRSVAGPISNAGI